MIALTTRSPAGSSMWMLVPPLAVGAVVIAGAACATRVGYAAERAYVVGPRVPLCAARVVWVFSTRPVSSWLVTRVAQKIGPDVVAKPESSRAPPCTHS